MAAGTIQKFFTDHGEVHYVTEKNGRKHFSFVNPKLDSNHRETIAYFKIFSALANYLPEAQLAAKNFIRLRDSHPNESVKAATEAAAVDCEKTSDEEDEENVHKNGEETTLTVEPSIRFAIPPAAAAAAAAAAADAVPNENSIFSKILYVYGKDPITRMTLIVSIFEGNPFITLKRFWHTSAAASAEAAAATAAGGAAVKSSSFQPGRWHACYGSFRFSLHDDALELYRFAKHCLLPQEEAEDVRRKFMSEMLQKRSSYHDAAIFPPAELCSPTKQQNLESKQIETNETKHSASSSSSSSSSSSFSTNPF